MVSIDLVMLMMMLDNGGTGRWIALFVGINNRFPGRALIQ